MIGWIFDFTLMNAIPTKINVVLLTDCLGNITGGAEKQIFELAKRLPKDQYNVSVVSMESQGETSKALIESIGCQLHVFRVIRIYGLSGFLQGLKFLSFLRQNSIHVIVTYHFGSDIWGTFWGHWAKVKTIISNRRDMGFWRNGQHILTYRLINPWVKRIVTVTNSIKQMVIDTEGVSADKIEVVYNGVEFYPHPVDIVRKKSQLGLNSSEIIIMHVANLRPVKGHQYLIEAFAKAVKSCNNIKLVLIGKDELNGSLQHLAQTLGIEDKILFLGQRTDIGELLTISDICVLPSLSEGMSNAILEYMAIGKPVIATQVGGNPELIQDGYNGLLVAKENIDQLSQALINLLEDPQKRRSMGEKGLSLIKEKFSMQTMITHYQELFKT